MEIVWNGVNFQCGGAFLRDTSASPDFVTVCPALLEADLGKITGAPEPALNPGLSTMACLPFDVPPTGC
jgi:hypothetical protein